MENHENEYGIAPTYEAATGARSAFLRAVAAWTLGGLALTAVVSVLSMLFVVPVVFEGGKWAVLGVVYGSFLLSQTVARKLVYGGAKVAGFVLGTTLQGLSLGFLLAITLMMTNAQDGLGVIGYALTMTLLATLAMLVYVSMEKREFSLIRAGVSMLFVPMLVLMGLQLVFPIGGTLGIVIGAVFLLVSVAGMLWKLNFVVHQMETTMPLEGGYEITLGVIVLFWNLLSLMNRFRRR